MSQTQEVILQDTSHQELRALSTSTNRDSNHAPATQPLSRTRAITAVVALSGVSFLNTMGSGILTVALPRMATDLGLNHDILLWPAARVWLTGSMLFAAFTLGCGLAQTGNQLIAFRALLGISIAMCLPCTVSLMTRTLPPGRARNLGFASMGMGQPLGYSVGLIFGGIFADSIGWRYGYYISAIINALLSVLAFWCLPREKPKTEPVLKGMKRIDWVGAPMISVSLALLSFVLACVYLYYYTDNPSFQEIQHRSALASSLMFLPMVIAGAVTNIFTGYTVDKISVGMLVFVSAVISTISPLLMALVNPDWGYWRGPFVAMLLSPIHTDVLFTVSNLIISRAYPGQNQALAGAVFNSVSQVGNSVGLAVSAAIAASVTEHSQQDTLKGFQAAYWLMFAAMLVLIATDIKTALPEEAVAAIVSQAPFAIVPGIFNLRDISNATIASSTSPAVLRSGLAYRGAAPVPTFTDEGIAALNALGIQKIYDLRRAEERTKKPSPVIDGVEVVWIPELPDAQPHISATGPPPDSEGSIQSLVQMYLGYLKSRAPVYKAVFEHIRDEPEKPFLFHCSAGKDRTGVLAALIHRLVGSSDEAIVHDFTLTRVGLEPGRQALLTMMQSLYGESALDNPVLLVLWGVSANGMTGFLKALDESHGGVTGYLKDTLGFSNSDIEIMKVNLTLDK
ncbi:major facilitator superfamily domain-containing protein [Aspergillus varians]